MVPLETELPGVRGALGADDPVDAAAPRRFKRIAVKLDGPPERLRAAFRSLGGDVKGATRRTSIYFDTGDRRLWSDAYTLATVEADGESRLVLRRETALGLVRPEWRSHAPTTAPDPKALPAEAPRAAFADILPGELLPRFRIRSDRAAVRAVREGVETTVAFDRAHVSAVGGDMRLQEIEIVLRAGGVGALLGFAGALAADFGLSISLKSKAARGVTLISDARTAAAKAGWPEFVPDVTVEQALVEILTTAAAHAFANFEIAGEGRDPGGVHQLRVALRRLRSALALFKPYLGQDGAALNAGARRALQSLGAARDLDVFLTETAPPVVAGARDHADFAPLLARAEKARRKAYHDVRKMLRQPDFVGFQTNLLGAASGGVAIAQGRAPLLPLAADMLRRGRRKTLRAGAGFALLPNAARHEARIALKKFRYACSYFQSLFPGPEVYAYRKRMSALQDDLGRLNDADVAAALVDRLAGRDAKARLAGAVIKGWYAGHLQANEAQMVASWEAFRREKPFWTGR